MNDLLVIIAIIVLFQRLLVTKHSVTEVIFNYLTYLSKICLHLICTPPHIECNPEKEKQTHLKQKEVQTLIIGYIYP